jgi:signal transduction histidine kinase
MHVDDLRHIFLFHGFSDEQLRVLIDLGDEVRFAEGDVLFREGEPAEYWWVLLDGRVELGRRLGREETIVNVMDTPGVWAGGFRAWDPTAAYITTGHATSPGRLFRMPAEALGERARVWFPFGVHMIEGFFQTVRILEARSHQREALVALGTLAAGLAHEINNPASAATRAVDALQNTCDTLLSSLVRLAELDLPAEKFVAVDALRREIDTSSATADPLACADREETLSDWLEAHEVVDAWRIAPTLAAAGVDLEWCERASRLLDGGALEPGLVWVASTLSTTALLTEMKESTGRISALVAAVKSYSQLDRASVQLINLTEGLDTTLVMLEHKFRGGITVVRDYTTELPRVEANAGELNQVWTNLIDNAIDAMDGHGTLRVSTRDDGDAVLVEIGDTGAGMPPDVQARAFEPFYTTKDVGKGTGLGLDIARRIVVERHNGELTIDVQPDETVLRVRLPLRHTAIA